MAVTYAERPRVRSSHICHAEPQDFLFVRSKTKRIIRDDTEKEDVKNYELAIKDWP